ncbi:phospholipid scramblase-related protein [Flavobacterium sp. MDT1-60]|uniref:phospholipid scramblase-related protein n=1 Tax=Flavobacterium sp. MDT1-60 TaxID=1979344 RepID=UPI00178262B2|nr:phospholipid scramblase-related protein [Flavobacterium sp. MDT1-60]QOG04316.1 scramblase [Flavobacterium sp. MDT1-60]
MISDFFETNNYFVDKKNSFQEHYNVYNDKRERIGRIKQKLTVLQKVLRLTVSKTLLPFSLEIRSANGGLEASILKKGLFSKSEIIVQDASGKKVGIINKKSKHFKPEFKILNSANEVIAEIGDVWKKSNFIINDSLENQIGTIDHQWKGSMKNVARADNSYNVNIATNYSNNEEKVAILSTAIVINMFF